MKPVLSILHGNYAGAVGRYGVILVLLLLTISVHLLPLSTSTLPFNNDSLTECRIAEDIRESGHFQYPEGRIYQGTQTVATPVFNLLIAFFSSTLGFSTFNVAYAIVVLSSLVTLFTVYVITCEVSGSRKGAIAAAMYISLFGTVVFLTGSAWKESLGFALLVLLFYAYMHRARQSMLALQITVMAVLPFVHHLVTAIAYLSIIVLTTWSVFHAVQTRRLGRRHLADVSIVGILSLVVFYYYSEESVDKLSYVTSQRGLISLILAYVLISVVAVALLMDRRRTKMSVAPIVAISMLLFLTWDYFNPVFSYSQGTPQLVFLLLCSYCVIMGVAWFGFEQMLESSSPFRAIPFGMLLPVIAVVMFALTMGDALAGHQIVYRTFDFAGLAIAVGVAVSVKSLSRRPKVEFVTIVAVLIALIVSFPFAYASGELLGVRHDTQEYEVDAIQFVHDASTQDMTFQSDERLSYIAMALFDFRKLPTLPSKLDTNKSLNLDVFYAFEEEWTTIGVNDYPRGHPVISETQLEYVTFWAQVVYVGGPTADNIVVFTYSDIGIDGLYYS